MKDEGSLKMAKWKIYTPEGMQDILPGDCYSKRNIEAGLRSLFRSFAYQEAETPAVEYLDVFSAEPDLTPQETMFKSFDQQGRILVLRPDITIPVARMAATKCRDMCRPLKIFYMGNMYRFDEQGGGKQKEFTQAGAELLGAATPEADAEVIALAVNSIIKSGLTAFQIDIGQVGFFKGLMQEAGLPDDEAEKIRLLIEKKDYIGIEELAGRQDIREDVRSLLLGLPGSFGSAEVIERFRAKAPNGKCLAALDNIGKVVDILADYGLAEYISVDLGMVQNLNYYTGIIFKGFTHGIGYPLLSGGRYDNLSALFGDNSPATGFSLGINMLMTALDRQKINRDRPVIDMLVCYKTGVSGARKAALEMAAGFRREGKCVETDVMCTGVESTLKYASGKSIRLVVEVRGAGDFVEHKIEWE